MDVNVGHFSDPTDAPGLAHFLGINIKFVYDSRAHAFFGN
jgi:hypothetical protein